MQSNWHDQEKHGVDIVLTLQEVQLRRRERKKKKKKNIPREWLKIFSSSYIQKLFIQPPSQARPWDNSRAMMVSKRDRSGRRWSVDVLVSVLPMKTVIMILRKYCHRRGKNRTEFWRMDRFQIYRKWGGDLSRHPECSEQKDSLRGILI